MWLVPSFVCHNIIIWSFILFIFAVMQVWSRDQACHKKGAPLGFCCFCYFFLLKKYGPIIEVLTCVLKAKVCVCVYICKLKLVYALRFYQQSVWCSGKCKSSCTSHPRHKVAHTHDAVNCKASSRETSVVVCVTQKSLSCSFVQLQVCWTDKLLLAASDKYLFIEHFTETNKC